MPFINNCFLMNATIFQRYDRSKITFSRGNLDADMSFCANLRDLDVFLYVSNRMDYGHLINPESFDVTIADPDMYQLFDNRLDWEKRYIAEEYQENFKEGRVHVQVCE